MTKLLASPVARNVTTRLVARLPHSARICPAPRHVLQLLFLCMCVCVLMQAESSHYQQQYHDSQQQLSGLQEKHQRQTLELEAQLREQAAAAQQDKLQQVAAVKEQLER